MSENNTTYNNGWNKKIESFKKQIGWDSWNDWHPRTKSLVKIFPIILILLTIPLTVSFLQQTQNLFQYASKGCHGNNPYCNTNSTPTPIPNSTNSTPTPTTSTSNSGFVQRSGTLLLLNGQPYKFTGINIYNANSRNNCWYSLGNNDGALDSTLTDSGVHSIRAWFTQGLATTNGVRDWAAFDHTLSVASNHNAKVIITLSVEDCGGDGVRLTDWFQSGYKTAVIANHTTTFRNYVTEIVSRYKNNPTILMWQIGNELDIKNADGSCGPASTLKSFVDDISGLIKSIDKNHLISIGTIGSGQCGAQGSSEYKTLHSSTNIDLCEYHDYSDPSSPMPGDQWNGLQTRINDCNSLNKPLFVGEAGIAKIDSNRASEFDAKISKQFAAGVVGFLPWEWRASGQKDGDQYIIESGDPTISVINKY